MKIHRLIDYKKTYNDLVITKTEQKEYRVFVWKSELFVQDPPETESEEVNNRLNTIRTNLKFELKRRFPRPGRIRRFEGMVYKILKEYFSVYKSDVVYSI